LKTVFLILFLGFTLLFGQNNSVEKKIYTHILYSIYPHKAGIKVWSDDKHKQNLLLSIPKVQFVTDPQKADFLIIQHNKNIQPKGVIFVTDYHLLQHYKNQAIGGFYWQKGRPNILFLRKNLQKHHIKLPKDMQEYIEDTL